MRDAVDGFTEFGEGAHQQDEAEGEPDHHQVAEGHLQDIGGPVTDPEGDKDEVEQQETPCRPGEFQQDAGVEEIDGTNGAVVQQGTVGFDGFGHAAGGVAPEQQGGITDGQVFGNGDAVSGFVHLGEDGHHANDEHGGFTQ